MNTNDTQFDSQKFPIERKPSDNAKREKAIERAIVIGTLLILALVAVVFYWKFATIDQATEGYSTLGIQTLTHY